MHSAVSLHMHERFSILVYHAYLTRSRIFSHHESNFSQRDLFIVIQSVFPKAQMKYTQVKGFQFSVDRLLLRQCLRIIGSWQEYFHSFSCKENDIRVILR